MRLCLAKQVFVASALSLVSLATALHAQSVGSFSGNVLLDNAAPLGGARVFYNRIVKMQRTPSGGFTPTEPMISASVVSLANGSFQVSNLPAGKYAVCAAGIRPNQLKSCDWGQSSSVVQVGSGPTSPAVVLKVRTGALLSVNIDDPTGLIRILDPTGIKRSQTNVVVGVISELGFYAARLSSTIGFRRIYTVAMPVGSPVRLFIDTPLNILDQAGRPVQRGAPSLPLQATGQGLDLNLAVGR